MSRTNIFINTIFGGFAMKDMLWIDNNFESENVLVEMIKTSSMAQQIKMVFSKRSSDVLSKIRFIAVPVITKIKGVSYRVDISFSLIDAKTLQVDFDDIDINSFENYYEGDFESVEDIISKNIYGILKFTEDTDFNALLIG